MISEIGNLAPLLFGLLLLPAASILVVAWAADGSLGHNGAAGIRTRYTKASDEAWAAGHAAALPQMKRLVPVASVGVLTSVAAQIIIGGHAGVVVAAIAFGAEVAQLLHAVGVANRAARAVTTGG